MCYRPSGSCSCVVPDANTRVLSPGQNQWVNQRVVAQRRAQEQQRQEDAQYVARDRHVLASVREEESWERRREQRQQQEEFREREMESALLKVGEQDYDCKTRTHQH